MLRDYIRMFTRSSHGVPDPVTSHFHTRWHPVRIGLFTEQDSGRRGSLAATVDALVAHRPHDASIIEYSAPANLQALLCARELVSRAAADRIDVVHVATTGPLAMVALLVASTLRPARDWIVSASRSGRERAVQGLPARARSSDPPAAGDVDGGAREA